MQNIQSKRNVPNFGYRLPNKTLNDARNIPNLVCANCGKNMMTRSAQDEFISSFSLSARDVLQGNFLQCFKNTFGYKFLEEICQKYPNISFEKSFGNDEVKDKLFLIKEFAEDGEDKLEEIYKLLNISKKYVKTSSNIIEKLKIYKDRLPMYYQDLLAYMELYSKKYPNKTFLEIFTQKEVVNYHEKRSFERNYHEDIKIDEAIRKLSYLSIHMSKKEAIIFSALIDRAKAMTTYINYPEETRIDALKNLYRPFLAKLEDKELAKKILDQLPILPMKKSSADALILYLRTFDDKGIIKNIMDNVTSTFEHIVPKSFGGQKALKNGIYLCKKCNNERGNSSYVDIVKNNPNFVINLQKQIDKIITFIKAGKLVGYQDYPLKVHNTFSEVTNNLVNINIDKYIKFRQQNYKQRLEEIEDMLSKNQKDLEKTELSIRSLDVCITELKNKIENSISTPSIKNMDNYVQEICDDIEFLEKQKQYLMKHREKCITQKSSINNFRRTTEISQDVFKNKIEHIL